MKIIASLALALLGISTSVTAQTQGHKHPLANSPQKEKNHRVVIQLSSADTLEHKALINNVKHLKEGWGENVMVEVVVHGPGIDVVTKGKSTQNEAIQQLISKGVRFVVCRNTMKQKNIAEDQILPNVGFVPMGVGEIVLQQEKGWSYLKAGF